jgi:hypothetical protein
MTESSSSDEKGPDPFQQMGGSDTDAHPSFDPPDSSSMDDPLSSAKVQASFALDMARAWVKDHQKATMLGAFASGVVLGALFRD